MFLNKMMDVLLNRFRVRFRLKEEILSHDGLKYEDFIVKAKNNVACPDFLGYTHFRYAMFDFL